jgi:hypothetical protein
VSRRPSSRGSNLQIVADAGQGCMRQHGNLWQASMGFLPITSAAGIPGAEKVFTPSACACPHLRIIPACGRASGPKILPRNWGLVLHLDASL